MLYFGYGSNMDWAQMKGRCPSARFINTAALKDYQLAFSRCSRNRGCGVADAVREPGQEVWGVVYQVSEIDVGKLDKAEGYQPGREKNSYWRRECMVLASGSKAEPLTAFTYFADPEPNPPPPNQSYKELILSGARYWRLPAEYIAELEQIQTAG